MKGSGHLVYRRCDAPEIATSTGNHPCTRSKGQSQQFSGRETSLILARAFGERSDLIKGSADKGQTQTEQRCKKLFRPRFLFRTGVLAYALKKTDTNMNPILQ